MIPFRYPLKECLLTKFLLFVNLILVANISGQNESQPELQIRWLLCFEGLPKSGTAFRFTF